MSEGEEDDELSRWLAEHARQRPAQPRFPSLPRALVELGVLESAHVRGLDRVAGRQRLRELLEAGAISELEFAQALSLHYGIPTVDLEQVDLDPSAAALIPTDFALLRHVLPIAHSESRVWVAFSDPTDVLTLDELELRLRPRLVERLIVTPSQLSVFLRQAYGAAPLPRTRRYRKVEAAPEPEPAPEASAPAPASPPDLRFEPSSPSAPARAPLPEPQPLDEASPEAASLLSEPCDAVGLVGEILAAAAEAGASDLHIEPFASETQIRLRVDGACRIERSLPASHALRILARLKILACLDVAERRVPQDGKLSFRHRGAAIEARVVTIPVASGAEGAVLRLFPAGREVPPLTQLSLSPRNERELRALLATAYGLVLCVGPTGSGKTTALHSMLAELNTPEKKVWTVEEPVEITQHGLNQVPVERHVGRDFAQILRAFLRADPDVIMVGELRDLETASTAVEASLTGHLVLATLHTNSAPETVTRLLDMKIEPFSFADSLLGILAQRLVRRICQSCARPTPARPEELETLRRRLGAPLGETLDQRRGRGCPACADHGYRGRIAVHELLVASETIESKILAQGTAAEIEEVARAEGMRTLLEDGLDKVRAGHTDLRQILAACRR